MTHTAALLNAIEGAQSKPLAQLAADQEELIGTITIELPDTYDPSSPASAPHIFSNRLDTWEQTLAHLSPSEVAELLCDGLSTWSRSYYDYVVFDPREKCLMEGTMSVLDHLTKRCVALGKQDPAEFAMQIIEEQKRCALLAMERFKTLFERLYIRHPQEALAAIQTVEPKSFEYAANHLNGFMDLRAIKANLEASALTPTEPRL